MMFPGKLRRHARFAAMIALILLLLSIASLLWISREREPPLRVGINSWPGYEFIHLARIRGLFQDQGLQVEVVEFNSLLDARRSFERGQIDGFAGTAIDVVLSLAQASRTPRIVQVIDYSRGGDLLLLDSSLEGIASLRGKRIGLEQGTVGSYLLARALSSAGLQLSDVRQVGADQSTLAADWERRRIDGLVTYPPFSVRILSGGRAKTAFTSMEIPGEIVDVLVFDSSTIANRKSDISNFLEGFWMARKLAIKDPAASIPLMAHKEGMTDSEFQSTLVNELRLVEASEQIDYLAPKGRLARVLEYTDSILRLDSIIDGPSRIGNAIEAGFAETRRRPTR